MELLETGPGCLIIRTRVREEKPMRTDSLYRIASIDGDVSSLCVLLYFGVLPGKKLFITAPDLGQAVI